MACALPASTTTQGESVSVLWDAELDAEVLADEGWLAVSKRGTDDPSVFSAYLRTLRWNTATAADRDLFQAPFRAGIHQDAYQLLPLRKALRLPRVKLPLAKLGGNIAALKIGAPVAGGDWDVSTPQGWERPTCLYLPKSQ